MNPAPRQADLFETTLGRQRIAVAVFILTGLCATTYLLTWARMLSSVFGTSTTACLMELLALALCGSTGVAPIPFFSRLSGAQRLTMLALAAALTPLLMALITPLYAASGGVQLLGPLLGNLVRLGLSVVVLGIPTFLVGGLLATLMSESSESLATDGITAAITGLALGAATACLASSCLLYGRIGSVVTLESAALVNLGVAWLARRRVASSTGIHSSVTFSRPAWAALIAMTLMYSVFAGMFLVWVRMLGALLGNSNAVTDFIAATCLIGVSLGCALYRPLSRVSAPGFPLIPFVTVLQGLALAGSYAVGDRVATLTLFLHPVSSLGVAMRFGPWIPSVALLVLLPSIGAGLQFSGTGHLLASDSGAARAARYSIWALSSGLLIGVILTGYLAIPRLSAPGAWRTLSLLVCLGGLAGLRRRAFAVLLGTLLTAGAMLCLFLPGPTAVWRHSNLAYLSTDQIDQIRPNVEDWLRTRRRVVTWECDGVEESVALCTGNGPTESVGGRALDNAYLDASTTSMVGVLGVLLNPNVRQALVTAPGCGNAAGWLATCPGVERVDIVEFEPSLRPATRFAAFVNHGAEAQEKIHLQAGDPREILETDPRRYDLIVHLPGELSAPVNAETFTREFYLLVASRLNPGGLFILSMRPTEMRTATMALVYSTLLSAFAHVETWQSQPGTVLLVCSADPVFVPLDAWQRRLQEEPLRTACGVLWNSQNITAVLAHFVGDTGLATAYQGRIGNQVSTDDRNGLELAFEEQAMPGDGEAGSVADLQQVATTLMANRPHTSDSHVDWDEVTAVNESLLASGGHSVTRPASGDRERRLRVTAKNTYAMGDWDAALRTWKLQTHAEPRDALELRMLAQMLANAGDTAAEPLITELSHISEQEALACLALLRCRQKRWPDAADRLHELFVSVRQSPLLCPSMCGQSLELVGNLSAHEGPVKLDPLWADLWAPFPAGIQNEKRLATLVRMALNTTDAHDARRRLCVEAYSPNFPWQKDFLDMRAQVSLASGNARSEQAQRDLAEFQHAHNLDFFDTAAVSPSPAPR